MSLYSPTSPIKHNRLAWYIQHLPNLVGYYPLNEISGTTANNFSPNNLHTINATNTNISGRQQGLVGLANTYNGTNSSTVIPQNTIPAWSGKSTLGLIIKVLSQPGGDTPLIDSQWGDDGGGGWQLIIGGDGNFSHAYVGDFTGRDDVAPIATFPLVGAYHFIVVTKNTTTGKQMLYIDGVLNNTNSSLSFGTTNPDTNIKLAFGANMILNTFLNATIQHVFFCSTDITANQIKKLAQITQLI